MAKPPHLAERQGQFVKITTSVKMECLCDEGDLAWQCEKGLEIYPKCILVRRFALLNLVPKEMGVLRTSEFLQNRGT